MSTVCVSCVVLAAYTANNRGNQGPFNLILSKWTLSTYLVYCLSCLCSGAGEVLADSVLALLSVTKLCIRDINSVPVLRVLSQNVEHCAVSTLAIALEHHPELVRSVSMGPCSTASTPQGTLVHTLCAWLYPSTCSRSVCCTFLYYDIIGQLCLSVCWSSVCYCTVSL